MFSIKKKKCVPRVWILKAMLEGTGILLVAGYLAYDKWWSGLIFWPYLYFFVRKKIKVYDDRQKEKLAIAFKDGMQSVTAALVAGYSLENAFRESLSELELLHGKKSEIYTGFAKIVNQLSLNINIEDVFAQFAEKSRIEDIKSFSQVLNFAKKSGGNLIEIIKETTDAIGEKTEVRREINTIISAKKLESSIMNLVPAGIILYMRFTSGEMFQKLYGNITGIVIMTVCLAVYAGAKALSDRIVDIKV